MFFCTPFDPSLLDTGKLLSPWLVAYQNVDLRGVFLARETAKSRKERGPANMEDDQSLRSQSILLSL